MADQIAKLRIFERIEKMEKEQMKNTEKANAKNKRIQKALERNLFGPNGTFNLRVSKRRCARQEPATPHGAPIPGVVKNFTGLSMFC